ncbi:hypothetical protein J6590_007922 [Homalodisca vitripennis]|nr:hypothetical protein J6590_007922 [Homalodisca vitripennis]
MILLQSMFNPHFFQFSCKHFHTLLDPPVVSTPNSVYTLKGPRTLAWKHRHGLEVFVTPMPLHLSFSLSQSIYSRPVKATRPRSGWGFLRI